MRKLIQRGQFNPRVYQFSRTVIYSLSLVLMLAVCLQAASAITDLGGVKATTCIQLPQTCATCTYNNLSSVQLPDKTYALQGEYAMQKTGTSYNYTFCNTVQLGTYLVDGHGDIGGVDTGWGGYIFEVTSSGFTIGVGQSLIYILFLLICTPLCPFILFLPHQTHSALLIQPTCRRIPADRLLQR